MSPDVTAILLTVLMFTLSVFATRVTVKTYRVNKLLDEYRANIESRRNWVSTMMACHFCLSHWVAFGVCAVTFLKTALPWWAFPIYWLAVADSTQIVHKLIYHEKEE